MTSSFSFSLFMLIATMASFQVEIANSSPFGCAAVHNHHGSCFQNNLSDLVSSCIPNDNSSRHIDITELWVHRPQWQTTTTTTTTTTNNNNCNLIENDPSNLEAHAQNHKDKRTRAREMVFSGDRCSSKGSGDSSLVEVPNWGGVSSLVQKWRGFEAEAKCSSRNNSATVSQDALLNNVDDAFGDWDSDRTAVSGPPSSRGRESDATESEGLRVADIIRKLTEDRFSDFASDSPSRVRISLDESEQRCFSPLVGSPRIRGRQAHHDLLTQMERDRRKELEGLVGRKVVSKFSHRGRIQAMLRIRLLRRGMEAKEGCHSNSTSPESHKAMQYDIARFRERVNPSAPNASVHSGCCHKKLPDGTPAASDLYAANEQGKENQYQEVINSKISPRVRAGQVQDLEGSITSREHDEGHNSHEVTDNREQSVHALNNHEAGLLSTFMRQGINWESGNHSLVESAETARTFLDTEINSAETRKSLHNIEINVDNNEKEITNELGPKSNHGLTGDCAHPQNCHEEEVASNQELGETATYWVSDVSHPEVGWEELHSDYQQQAGSNRNWIDEVSRPRSDWEGLRQARYQEMLDPFLDNEEIRTLLGRRSVSTFLSGDLRQKIDQVMIFRAQGQQALKNNHTQEEKHEKLPEREQAVVLEDGDGKNSVDKQDEEVEDYSDNFDDYEEAESSVGQQCIKSDDYTDHITSSPPASWAQNHHELSDYSYQVSSPSTQQSSSNFYPQNNGSNYLYSAHPAIEMELIYDLRGRIEQLHQEMSELRKSIKYCMDIQIKLQRSIRKEVAIALNHSDAKNGRQNSVKKIRGGRCCICCKMQVDSLLYRCGHMCTCYKCAHELQMSSGKCPICMAPILDVVRACSKYS